MDFRLLLTISSFVTTAIDPTPTAVRIAAAFGLGIDRQRTFRILDNLTVDIAPGHVLLVIGQSGSGKSTLLRILKRIFNRDGIDYLDLDDVELDNTKILPDHLGLPLEKALHVLSLAGLADAFIFLRKPNELSDGQLYRFKLAVALARCPAIVIADKYLENLDRISARIIAHNTRKFADTFNTAFILAAANDDIVDALKPDTLIEKHFGSEHNIQRRTSNR